MIQNLFWKSVCGVDPSNVIPFGIKILRIPPLVNNRSLATREVLSGRGLSKASVGFSNTFPIKDQLICRFYL